MRLLLTRSLKTLTLLLLFSQSIFAQVYFDDTSFSSSVIKSTPGLVSSIIVQPDGKILVMGDMSYVDNVYSSAPIRLNADGTRDASFHSAPHRGYFSIALRSDGKIIAESLYSGENGTVIQLELLSQNGELESTFVTSIASDGVITRNALAVQEDNKVVVGSLVLENGIYKGSVNRLNTDGTLDGTFSTGDLIIKWISLIVIQPDGKILVGGHFESPGGVEKSMLRLNSDGSVDMDFNSSINSLADISAIHCQQDGKILVGTNNLIRLNQDGSPDITFNNYSGALHAFAVQPDGKILVSSGTESHSQVTRLNPDDTVDPFFDSGDIGADRSISTLAVTVNGTILAGGYFTNYNGQPTHGLVQLGSDGSLDPVFRPKLESMGQIQQVVAMNDGKFIVAGSFDAVDDYPRGGIARFNADGTLDDTFNIGTGTDGFHDFNGGSVLCLAIQNDDRILVGGSFTSFNGRPANGLVRLNADGSTDLSFTYTESEVHDVTALAVQSNGDILISGTERNSGDNFCRRLKSDGSIDPTFETDFNGPATNLLVQEDGKIIATGYFTEVNSLAVGHIVRLTAEGSIDDTFLASGTTGVIEKILIQPDSKLLVVGYFSDFNSVTVSSMVRLNPDGTIDPSFNTVFTYAYIQDIFLRADGKMLLTGSIDYQPGVLLNADGSVDNLFFIITTKYPHSILLELGTRLIGLAGPQLVGFKMFTDQTIDFPPIPDKFNNSSPFELEATASSGLPVTYTVLSGPATVSGNQVTLTGEVGVVTIVASQVGDATYAAAPLVERSFKVNLVTGVEENEQHVVIYPVPASDKFVVRLTDALHNDEVSLRLFDIHGADVNAAISKDHSGFLIETWMLPRGVYVLHLSGKHIQSKHRVILN